MAQLAPGSREIGNQKKVLRRPRFLVLLKGARKRKEHAFYHCDRAGQSHTLVIFKRTPSEVGEATG